MNDRGFGLIGIIMVFGIVAVLAAGSFLLPESSEDNELDDVGVIDAIEEAEDAKEIVEERNEDFKEEIADIPTNLDIFVPILYPEVNWQEVSFDPSRTADFQVGFKNFKYVEDIESREIEFRQLPGRLWKSTNTNLSSEQRSSIIKNFREYYQNSLAISVWDWQVDSDDNNISFTGPSAGGPLGSISGYVRIQNEKSTLVGLSFHTKDHAYADVNGPREIICPCTLELEVFVSDETQLSEFSF